MGPKRILFFHSEFWEDFFKLSVQRQAIAGLVATILTFCPVAVLIWALITYAQETFTDSDTCKDSTDKDRSLDLKGFAGNSDFYGFGIRLGIYFQWAASLIANPLPKDERATMAGAYLTFSLALAIAILILAFQHQCAFTAEIIVVLNIFWGGTLLVMVPFVRLLADIRTTGLGLALIPLILSMLPISAWFWLRLAIHGQVDFVKTRGGTSFFFLARVEENHIRGVSALMATLSLILCLIPVFSSLCLCLVLFLDWMSRRSPQWGIAVEEKGMRQALHDRLEKWRPRWMKVEKEKHHNKWYELRAVWAWFWTLTDET